MACSDSGRRSTIVMFGVPIVERAPGSRYGVQRKRKAIHDRGVRNPDRGKVSMTETFRATKSIPVLF
jgi:hypothetical protein